MATPAESPSRPVPLTPTAEAWRAMTLEQRERVLTEILDALEDAQSAMSEGQRHKKAKGQAIDKLTLHFNATGRVIYLAEELAVLYPGERGFTPDILAVSDVPQPDDDPRMAWVVTDEGKGLDLVLEVLHHGNRKKDLVDNAERYARLGIPEYFIYDRARQQVHGYRLPGLGATRYQRVIPQFGRHGSQVLGLDLAVEHGKLRFFYGMSELFGSDELIGRLKSMVEDLENKAEDAETKVELALTEGLREAVLALLDARGLPCPDDARARVASCFDAETLRRWIARAATAASVDEVLAG